MIILQRKRHYERNLESPVKNCPSVSLICQSESVRRGLILSGCDSWGLVQDANTDADKDRLNRLDRLEVNVSDDSLLYNSGQKLSGIFQQNNEDGTNIDISSSFEAGSRRQKLDGERCC